MTDSLDALWRAADDPPPPLSPGALRALKADAVRLRRQLVWRDVREIGAAALGAAWFGVVAAATGPLRLPALVLVAASVWVVAVLVAVRLGARHAVPDAPPRVAVAAEHRWLSVQTALLRWAGLWYVAPILLGLATFFWPDRLRISLAVAVAAVIVWLNGRAAQRLAATRDAFGDLLIRLDPPAP